MSFSHPLAVVAIVLKVLAPVHRDHPLRHCYHRQRLWCVVVLRRHMQLFMRTPKSQPLE